MPLPRLKTLVPGLPAEPPKMVALLMPEQARESGRKLNAMPDCPAGTNARRQAGIGALGRLVVRWIVMVEFASF